MIHWVKDMGFSKLFSNVVYLIYNFLFYHQLFKSHLAFTLHLFSLSIYSHFQEAFEDPKWKSAMVENMKALQKNFTCEIVELSLNKKTIRCN